MTLDNLSIDEMQSRLITLREEHRDLDDAILRLSSGPSINELQLRRLKKRKLFLKDAISRIETLLIPDLNA
ncbi:MAG: YdcH family protein [gamma proteobacterium symbiont of Phacoides pectinatus]